MSFKLLPVKPMIKYEDFAKVDIRLGRIEKVEDVPEKKVPDGSSAG